MKYKTNSYENDKMKVETYWYLSFDIWLRNEAFSSKVSASAVSCVSSYARISTPTASLKSL